jgi:hypothetical protein
MMVSSFVLPGVCLCADILFSRVFIGCCEREVGLWLV